MKRNLMLMTGGTIAALLVGIAIGVGIGRNNTREKSVENVSEHAGHEQAQVSVWTCAMHPQIKLPKPGKCPICLMELVPLSKSQDNFSDDGPSRIVMSPLARKLASIATVPAVRRGLKSEIRLTGKIAIDETRQEVISSRFHGRIDRLYVNSTGIAVRKGDHLADIYSPDLVSAQQELLNAAKALSSSTDVNLSVTYKRILDAAKEKLRLLGFSEADINIVLSKNEPSDHMTIRSGQGGIVLEKMAVEGAYVETGMPLYTIADLKTLWVKLDAYESDLGWLKPGQKVEFTVEAWPGEVFTGTTHLIDPVIDPMMRTAKVRVETSNPDNRLKPEMLVRALVRADISSTGKILGQNIRGKWICPMHPNIVKNSPGKCDICEMPLETAQSLGYGTSGIEKNDPLVIPATAPLVTGERAIVYVQIDSSEQVVYEGKEVVLGPRVGDYYVVKSGLTEGENVVVSGVFQIDSELQIKAKKSMMNPNGGGTIQTGHAGHGKVATSSNKQPETEIKPAPVETNRQSHKDGVSHEHH
ncbi:MAG TPA: efflux RND transporter periplasmic adaptor subunit [Chitinispirillaceae bacterium]|nr:efflux RND transporter periplasmic adaptor subunit [Chitinispirillaceae bacterium]